MKESAGILVFRRKHENIEVLLVHPGGPIWGKRDRWSIPKGELDENEDRLQAAYREFEEELGSPPPAGEPLELGSAKVGSKVNRIWAIEGDFELSGFKCNTFTMEWPPRSGHLQEFPECDRAAWFDPVTARQKLYESQVIFLDNLARHLELPS